MQQSYERPNNLDEALTLLDQSPRQVLAGGTDVYAALGDHSSLGHVLDVTAIPDLTGIKDAGDHWRIGASSTWSDVLAANLPKSFDFMSFSGEESNNIFKGCAYPLNLTIDMFDMLFKSIETKSSLPFGMYM